MSIYLSVPYANKDFAKSHGAKWDKDRRQWYYPGDELPAELRGFTSSVYDPDTKKTFYRCPRCGTTGYGGGYPFSTCPPRCDDCN